MKILILGGGLQQLPAIRKALEAGLIIAYLLDRNEAASVLGYALWEV